jgi:uncharacterized protein involved in exopolysaccharide biosynthesis
MGQKIRQWRITQNYRNHGIAQSRMDLRPVRNTSLIEIRVYSDRPEEAARIANAIATAYKDHRLKQRLSQSRGGIVALEERFKKQEKEIEQARRKSAIYAKVWKSRIPL